MQKILIIEDDLNLGFLLMEFLETEGYQVKLCRDGVSGLSSFQKESFNLCIIDVMLPQMDGFTLARSIQKQNRNTPFLFLTARSMKQDKLQGYSIGCEDYITKPFDEEELLWRIKVIMRRNEEISEPIPTQFQIGQYFFDYNRQELTFNNQPKRLTEKENEVLRLLCLNKNEILKRDDAVEEIYGERDYFLGRSFDVFISRLRKMLRNDPNVSIDNVFKVGFILNIK